MFNTLQYSELGTELFPAGAVGSEATLNYWQLTISAWVN